MSAGLVRTFRLTLGLCVLVGLLGIAAVFLSANELLSLFGKSYPSQAAPVLRIIVLGVLPLIVKLHFVAISRIRGRLSGSLLLMAVGALFEIFMAAIGARIGGLTGLSLGWVSGLCVEAILFGPVVVRFAAAAESASERRLPMPAFSSGIDT